MFSTDVVFEAYNNSPISMTYVSEFDVYHMLQPLDYVYTGDLTELRNGTDHLDSPSVVKDFQGDDVSDTSEEPVISEPPKKGRERRRNMKVKVKIITYWQLVHHQ